MCVLSPLLFTITWLVHSDEPATLLVGTLPLVTDSVIYVSRKNTLFYERPFYVEANASVSTRYVTIEYMCCSSANTGFLSCRCRSTANLKGRCEMLNNHAATKGSTSHALGHNLTLATLHLHSAPAQGHGLLGYDAVHSGRTYQSCVGKNYLNVHGISASLQKKAIGSCKVGKFISN